MAEATTSTRSFGSSEMLRALLMFGLVVSFAQGLPQLEFSIDVTASFNPNTPTPCTYCDNGTDPNLTPQYREAGQTSCTYSIGNIAADDCQIRWGSVDLSQTTDPFCFNASGAGFRGLKGVSLISNPTNDTPTKIGEFTHYNNVIYGGSPAKLRLTMNVTSPQLNQPFIISYPLGFFETSNTEYVSGCDPSLQYHDRPCDDRFTFNTDIGLQASFVVDNVRYTLEIVGFSQAGSASAVVRYFSTLENNASRADVYARLVTVCDSSACGRNEQFFTENCTCGCLLDDALCSTTLGPNWTLNKTACDCMCGLTAATANCTDGLVWNQDTCSCGCNLTDSYCSSINASYEVIGEGKECMCGCPRDTALYCARVEGRFYEPAGNSCACECAVTDAKCSAAFGKGYKANTIDDNCGCIIPGGGLSDGDKAGIVIGAVVGSAILVGLFIAAGALLVYFIRAGKIAGIYGYKLEPALLDNVSESPLYNSPWSNNNQLN